MCIRDSKFMVLLFCEVRRYSLMLALNLGVVGVKAEGCNRPLLRLCMASEREEEASEPKREGAASEAGCSSAGHQPRTNLRPCAHLAEAWPV